jgi:hypothetical protein
LLEKAWSKAIKKGLRGLLTRILPRKFAKAQMGASLSDWRTAPQGELPMKLNNRLIAGVSVLAIAAVAAVTTEASARQTFYPYKLGGHHVDSNRPVQHVGPWEAPYLAPKKAKSGTWTDVSTKLPFANGPWGSMLMTDGTILVEDYCTSPAQWYKLTPDKKGQYTDGTWSAIATMPSGYSPLFFGQQVLTDGRVIVNGGEYNDCNGDWTNLGALYDPVKNSWTSVTAPSGWSTIGDAESVILPNGTYMLANCCDRTTGHAALATISGTKVTWSIQPTITCPSGDPCNDEQGFTALPGGDLMMVDVWNTGSNYDQYEIYDTSAGTWSVAGKTASFLTNSGFELGAGALTPQAGKQGVVMQFGADTSNNVYDVQKGKWSKAPSFSLSGYDCADAPAATLPDGNVLTQASPGEFNSPSHFFEASFSKKGKAKLTQVNDTKQAPSTSSFESTMLLVPTGQVFWVNSQVTPNEVALYTPAGKAKAKWLPVVSNVSSTLTVGSTANAISGKNFNGFDLGGVYGDDAQSATNFPVVRITNNSTGDVCFGRSYSFSTMGVWTSGTTTASFDLPSSCETGASTLQVVVNGIASAAVSVTLNS